MPDPDDAGVSEDEILREMLERAKADKAQAQRYADQYAPFSPVVPGTLNLQERPHVRNPDGSTSTVRSMGVNLDGKEYLLPTVSRDGRILGDDEAIEEFRRTGEHLGIYGDQEASDRAGRLLHQAQEKHPPLNVTIPQWLQYEPPKPTSTGPRQLPFTMLTNRPDDPVHDQTELERGRGAKAAEMMGSEYWGGAPMYYEPASTYNYTDQINRNAYLERLQQDYAHRAHERSAAEKLDDVAYEEVWDQMKYEKMGFPDWAFRPGTPPRWPETWK